MIRGRTVTHAVPWNETKYPPSPQGPTLPPTQVSECLPVRAAISPFKRERPPQSPATLRRPATLGQTPYGFQPEPIGLDPIQCLHQNYSGGMPKSSSSSSWMMIRGVTINMMLSVSRPTPEFLKRRLM